MTDSAYLKLQPGLIIVFDGHCRLCNGWVKFLLARDHDKQFHFAAVQAATGRRLLEQAGFSALDPETMLFVQNGKSHSHTDAILRVLWQLGGAWRLAADGVAACVAGLSAGPAVHCGSAPPLSLVWPDPTLPDSGVR